MKWLRDEILRASGKVVGRARGEEGQALVLVALSMTVLMGFVALATDVGVMLRQKRVAQRLADSAAIAAAYESLYERTPGSVTAAMYSAAYQDLSVNGFTPSSTNGATNTTSGVTLSVAITPNVSVAGYNSAGYVQATVALKALPIFAGFLGFGATTVNATAIASDQLTSNGCVYVTDYTGDEPSLDVATGHNSITTTNCSVQVTGNIDLGGSSTINAGTGGVFATGTINDTSSITASTIAAGAAPQTPPLVQLQSSSYQPTISGNSCTPPANSGFTSAQCYVNKSLSGTLSPGIYAFTQPPSFGSSVTGSNVVIYLQGSMKYDDGNNNINLSPPTSGIFKGVVFDAPSDSPGSGFGCPKGNSKNNVAGVLHMNFGSSSTTYQGIVYAPYAHLFMQDQGAGTTKINSDLVIGTICGQSANLEISGASSANTPITRVGLVY